MTSRSRHPERRPLPRAGKRSSAKGSGEGAAPAHAKRAPRRPDSTASSQLDSALVRTLVEAALAEDRVADDITTSTLVAPEQSGQAVITAQAEGILAGLQLAEAAFTAIDPKLQWGAAKSDGDRISPGDIIATIEGSVASVLRGERVALNFLAHLSGISSMAGAVVITLEGTECRLRDTRKTTPGLRALEKYAVRTGGGTNHRFDLSDGILIKDNHLAALKAQLPAATDHIREAVRLARKANPGMAVEVEVTNLEETQCALDAGADELLLDNMSLRDMKDAVGLAKKRKPRPRFEASGGITLGSARAVADTGVDFISMGAITHSAPALDLSLELDAH